MSFFPKVSRALRSPFVCMEKSVFTQEYHVMLMHLRKARKYVGLTQAQLGERLGQDQSFVSRCERGEHRLDAIELRAFCKALGISVSNFFEKLEPDLLRVEREKAKVESQIAKKLEDDYPIRPREP